MPHGSMGEDGRETLVVQVDQPGTKAAFVAQKSMVERHVAQKSMVERHVNVVEEDTRRSFVVKSAGDYSKVKQLGVYSSINGFGRGREMHPCKL
jgi:hypothetical protein